MANRQIHAEWSGGPLKLELRKWISIAKGYRDLGPDLQNILR